MTLTEAEDAAVMATLESVRTATGHGPLTLGMLGAALAHGGPPRIRALLEDVRGGGSPVLVEVGLRDLDGRESTDWHIRLSDDFERPIPHADDSKVIGDRVHELAPILRPHLLN